MNKEQKIFKKVIKKRIKKAGKKIHEKETRVALKNKYFKKKKKK